MFKPVKWTMAHMVRLMTVYGYQITRIGADNRILAYHPIKGTVKQYRCNG